MKARVSLKKYTTAVVDCETDPFKQGRISRPFTIGLYWDGGWEQFWGADCVDQLFRYLRDSELSFIIYAHNGGKFDFLFFFAYLENPIIVINGRITQASAYVSDKKAKHIFQDSYAILPFPLEAYRKTEIDYGIFEAHLREIKKNREKISAYLYDDCRDLFALVSDYQDTFGHQLTVGSNAMKQLRKLHSFDRCDPKNDAYFRQYYFGGRVQCFEVGVLKGPFRVLDINSAYPAAMKNCPHPFNGNFESTDKMPDSFEAPFFIKFTGRNYGALPVRTKSGLSFDCEDGMPDENGVKCFYACSHEMQVGLEKGLIEIDRVISCDVSLEYGSFGEFVDKFYGLKSECKASGDKIGELKWKYVVNSAYGKFAQNPENYYDWKIFRGDEKWNCCFQEHLISDNCPACGQVSGWELYSTFPEFEIHRRKAEFNRTAYYDVAIAASITSATRAMLLRGIQESQRPIYCDTDSLVCVDFQGQIDPLLLGAWKDEGTADYAAIAGKKLYSLFKKLPVQAERDKISTMVADSRARRKYEKELGVIKVVSKGGNLSWPDIVDLCQGKEIDYASPVPVYSIRGAPKFQNRNFTVTDKRFDRQGKMGDIG